MFQARIKNASPTRHFGAGLSPVALRRFGGAEQYQSRLEEIELKLEKLKLWTLDPYDLLLSKTPRNREKDQDDSKYVISKVKLKFETLETRWKQEMAPWISNRDRHDLTVELWKEYFAKT